MVVTRSMSTSSGVSLAARLVAAVIRLSRASCAVALLAVVAIVWSAGRAADAVVHSGMLATSGLLLLLASLVDLAEYRLPNSLVAGSALAAVAGPVIEGNLRTLLVGLLGGLLCGGAMLTIHLRRGVGMGDVKAAAAVGIGCASLELAAAAVALALGSAVAALCGLITRRQRLPLGPSLVAGWIAAVLLEGGR